MRVDIHCSHSRLIRYSAVALACVLAVATRGYGSMQTTTTTYEYNADGAATAVTTQVDAQPATTTYLTWDNFTPDASAPSTGTVSAANGNLIGVGASPGSSGLTTQFTFDVRDRLTGCSASGQLPVSYAYHPTSQMASSTLSSGDALQFYYDSGATPMMVNTLQPSTGLADSFLGPLRYLSDGTEQAVLLPRKDTAGVYEPAAQTLSPLSYEPYGAPLAGSAASSGLSDDGSSYDLSANPFQYGGEYQDPSCSAYYLRARWYLPAQQTFLSRDPADALHRYGYTAGNPIGRTDPSGLKYTGGDFSRGVDRAVSKLTPGISKYLEPILPVWGQVLGSVELLGDLPSFWHHPTTEGWVDFGFLAASMVSEAGTAPHYLDELPLLRGNPTRAFGTRIGIDLALGGSQTVAQSDRHGRLDTPALIEGIDSTLFGTFWARGAAGIGYRPFGLTVDDVDTMAAAHAGNASNLDKALVFRVRSGDHAFTSPLLEQLHLGNYHEAVLAVSQDALWRAEVGVNENGYTWQTRWSRQASDLRQPSKFISRGPREIAFVGTFSKSAVETALRDEMSFGEQAQLSKVSGHTASDFPGYGRYSNNCQNSAARIRANIVGFQRQPVENINATSDN